MMLRIQHAAQQGRCVESDQKDTWQRVERLPIVKVPEDGIEAVRLVGVAQEARLFREVPPSLRQIAPLGQPGDELRRVTGVSAQLMQSLGESVSASAGPTACWRISSDTGHP